MKRLKISIYFIIGMFVFLFADDQFLKKGSSVYAEGRLRTDSWTSKEGEPRFTNEIVANQVVFLDKRSDNMSGPESNDTPQTDNAPQSDNLPW